MPPRVLLLQPASYPSREQDFGVPHLLSLAGWIERECGVTPVVRDLRHERDPKAALDEALDEAAPLLVGVSCYASFDYLDALATVRRVRERLPGTPIVVGGYHASACPEDFAEPPGTVDHVVVGDGERALEAIVRAVMGGGERPPAIVRADAPVEPDEMPPTPFHLLERYRSIARGGRVKLQVNLSRGCPHRCTFCMERAKPDREWRAFSPERAIEEIGRLDRVFPIADQLLHVTDPLFGMRSSWRRAFLSAFASGRLRPRLAWTLTRTEGLEPEDLRLFAVCRFSIGVGLESGSPAMLRLMQKTGQPERYLEGFLRLREEAGAAGALWAVNVLVGHPGETPGTMAESLAYLDRLFPPGEPTRGWLSVDPYRLYPGSEVHRARAAWTEAHGTRFFAPAWWRDAAARDVTAELVDPSRDLDAWARLDAQFTRYRATVLRVCEQFRCDDERAASLFARSLDEQRDAFAPEAYERRRREFGLRHPAAVLPQGPPPAADLGLPRADSPVAVADLAGRSLGWGGAWRVVLWGDRDPAVETALLVTAGHRLRATWVSGRPSRWSALRRAVAERLRPGRRRPSPAAAALAGLGRDLGAVIVLGACPDLPRALSAWLRARAGRRAVVPIGPRFGEQRIVQYASTPDGVRSRTLAVGRLAPARGEGGWVA
jgi:radical SAM superfamily enzyme YgiQ (UPF0313 family)